MSQMQLLRLFISERLSAAAEEIFAAVQRTIAEQDGEQRGLKREAPPRRGDTPQLFAFAHEQKHPGQEWSPESCHPGVDREDCDLLVPEPPVIKQEQPWSSPEGPHPLDTEDADASASKVTLASIKSCISSDGNELQTHDTGSEDRKPVANTSADHRTVEGNAQSSSGCWTRLPDCSVTLNNMGPELGLATLTANSIGKYHTQSCEPGSPSPPPNEETGRRGKPYRCRFCGKEFSHGAHLAAHTQIHTGDKPFVCGVCGKEFRHGNSVAVHMRIHTEERPYRCGVCGKEFRHVGNLNVHTRIHTGEKPYTCAVCGKKFSRNNLMTKHMAVHGGETSPSVLRRGFVGMTS